MGAALQRNQIKTDNKWSADKVCGHQARVRKLLVTITRSASALFWFLFAVFAAFVFSSASVCHSLSDSLSSSLTLSRLLFSQYKFSPFFVSVRLCLFYFFSCSLTFRPPPSFSLFKSIQLPKTVCCLSPMIWFSTLRKSYLFSLLPRLEDPCCSCVCTQNRKLSEVMTRLAFWVLF